MPFQQEFTIYECDFKTDSIGHPESDKYIRIRLPVLLGIQIRLHQKPPTPYESATLPAENKRTQLCLQIELAEEKSQSLHSLKLPQ